MYINLVNLDVNEQVLNSLDSGNITQYAFYYNALELDKINKDLPTLYVGSKVAKILYPDLDPTEHRLSDTEFWCFSMEESATYFVYMFKKFLEDVPEALIKKVKYKPIDPLFNQNLMSVVKGKKLDVIYVRGNHMFISCGYETYGLNIDFFEGIGMGREYLGTTIRPMASKWLIDVNDKIFNFFTDTFKYDPITVERYIPYLINLKR
jgi:hypothetical protein